MHGNRISRFLDCYVTADYCACSTLPDARSTDAENQSYRYINVLSCDTVVTSIKDYFILQCALNSIASGVCLWFVSLLWKSRYAHSYHSHSGRFYPYTSHSHWSKSSAHSRQTISSHNNHPQQSPICIKRPVPAIKRDSDIPEIKCESASSPSSSSGDTHHLQVPLRTELEDT